MSTTFKRYAALCSIPVLVSCATLPEGPSVMALPGSGKNFQTFTQDDVICRNYAQNQLSGETANQAAISSGVVSAAIGTGLGAAAGAAFGGGSGAAVGAGAGLLAGSAFGTGTAADSGSASQRSYDNFYIQCMYGQGHRVPVSAQFSEQIRNSAPQTQLPPPPPPPPGNPPPPPRLN